MAEPKKRKSECRKFQTRWESEYFFKEFKEKCVCVICTETVAVMKEYNVRRHYETKHRAYASDTGAEREQKLKQRVALLQGQQQYLFRAQKVQEKAPIANYEVAQLITRHGVSFSDGDLIKHGLVKVTEIMCPEKVQDFNNVSVSRNTVVRRIEDSSANIKLQLSDKAVLLFFTPSQAMRAPTPQTPHSCYFLWGVDESTSTLEYTPLCTAHAHAKSADLI
ncbi:general transcription factor II-I repeat domain-containing protein 2-like [Simochromis diagramma]|uniref:general transcription factor II-I repeat domain-containing protein 2-like n=1 Tax=Simochromis diagramma TaxID=43689 RepID=UPI001A7E6CB0|nr:general transcription factor II-I repeat domain-containing protein 2-like [Simochromis diagramma]